MDKEKNTKAVSEENIYCLNGRVPVKKAIPFGLQHFKMSLLALVPFGKEIS